MKRPNVLLVMCDQFRGDCLSFDGHPDVKTPYLDTYETEGEMDANGKFKGSFKATGIIPKCVEKIRENGVGVNNDWFIN